MRDDDGVDPRKFFDRRQHGKGNRKALQLCSQVKEALDFALAESADERLQSVVVVDVKPNPDSSRMLAQVTVLRKEATSAELDDLAAALDENRGRLRCEVAAAITRRKTPQLVFQVVLPLTGEGWP